MRLLMLFCLILLPGLATAKSSLFEPIQEESPFLTAQEAFQFSASEADDGGWDLDWTIASGYYLYRGKLKFQGMPTNARPALPVSEPHDDPIFGRVEIYRDHLSVHVPPGAGLKGVQWQGCAEAGLCYQPQSAQLAGATASSEPAQTISAGPAGRVADDVAVADRLANQGLLVGVAVFFGLGVLLAFTPCSLPMLPILASIVVGTRASTRRSALLGGVYVLAMALVYAGLGLVAAMVGEGLQAILQRPSVLLAFAMLFVVLAMPMFGLFELQLPSAIRNRLEQAGNRQQGGSIPGAAVLGLLSGLLIGPCMTAPLAGALLYISQSGDLVQGGLVLFALGLGIGAPLMVVAVAGKRFLPKPGAWMEQVKVVFGFLFLFAALLITRPLLEPAIWMGALGAILLAMAYSLFAAGGVLQRAKVLLITLAIGTGLWGATLVVASSQGGSDPLHPLRLPTSTEKAENALAFTTVNNVPDLDRELEAARAEGEWVLLDYYADWCVSCLLMERDVFSLAAVQKRLEGVRLLKLDVTERSPATRALLNRFKVPGPPVQVWIGPNGDERRGERITGEIDAEGFLTRLDALKIGK